MNVSCIVSSSTCVTIKNVPYCQVSRGGSESETFTQIGFVRESNKDPKALYGKRVNRASNEWQYYILDKDTDLKIPVMERGKNCMTHRRGCKEIENGDKINVLGYSDTFTTFI